MRSAFNKMKKAGGQAVSSVKHAAEKKDKKDKKEKKDKKDKKVRKKDEDDSDSGSEKHSVSPSTARHSDKQSHQSENTGAFEASGEAKVEQRAETATPSPQEAAADTSVAPPPPPKRPPPPAAAVEEVSNVVRVDAPPAGAKIVQAPPGAVPTQKTSVTPSPATASPPPPPAVVEVPSLAPQQTSTAPPPVVRQDTTTSDIQMDVSLSTSSNDDIAFTTTTDAEKREEVAPRQSTVEFVEEPAPLPLKQQSKTATSVGVKPPPPPSSARDQDSDEGDHEDSSSLKIRKDDDNTDKEEEEAAVKGVPKKLEKQKGEKTNKKTSTAAAAEAEGKEKGRRSRKGDPAPPLRSSSRDKKAKLPADADVAKTSKKRSAERESRQRKPVDKETRQPRGDARKEGLAPARTSRTSSLTAASSQPHSAVSSRRSSVRDSDSASRASSRDGRRRGATPTRSARTPRVESPTRRHHRTGDAAENRTRHATRSSKERASAAQQDSRSNSRHHSRHHRRGTPTPREEVSLEDVIPPLSLDYGLIMKQCKEDLDRIARKRRGEALPADAEARQADDQRRSSPRRRERQAGRPRTHGWRPEGRRPRSAPRYRDDDYDYDYDEEEEEDYRYSEGEDGGYYGEEEEEEIDGRYYTARPVPRSSRGRPSGSSRGSPARRRASPLRDRSRSSNATAPPPQQQLRQRRTFIAPSPREFASAEAQRSPRSPYRSARSSPQRYSRPDTAMSRSFQSDADDDFRDFVDYEGEEEGDEGAYYNSAATPRRGFSQAATPTRRRTSFSPLRDQNASFRSSRAQSPVSPRRSFRPRSEDQLVPYEPADAEGRQAPPAVRIPSCNSSLNEYDILSEVEVKMDLLAADIMQHDELVEREMMSSPFERLYHMNNRHEEEVRKKKLEQYNKLDAIRNRLASGSLAKEVENEKVRTQMRQEYLSNPNNVYNRLYNKRRSRSSSRDAAGSRDVSWNSSKQLQERSSTPVSATRGSSPGPKKKKKGGEAANAFYDRLYLSAKAEQTKREEMTKQAEQARKESELEDLLVARISARLALNHGLAAQLLTEEQREAKARQELQERKAAHPDTYLNDVSDTKPLPASEIALQSARLTRHGFVSKEVLENRKAENELKQCTFRPAINADFLSSSARAGSRSRRSSVASNGSAAEVPSAPRGPAKVSQKLYQRAKESERRAQSLREDREIQMKRKILESKMANDYHFRKRVERDPGLAQRFMASLTV